VSGAALPLGLAAACVAGYIGLTYRSTKTEQIDGQRLRKALEILRSNTRDIKTELADVGFDANENFKTLRRRFNRLESLMRQYQIGKTTTDEKLRISLEEDSRLLSSLNDFVVKHFDELRPVIGLPASLDELKASFAELQSTLLKMLRVKLPTDKVPPVSRWIELRHDAATLMQRHTLTEAAESILKSYENGSRHFLIVGPVASGKSTTTADVSRQLLSKPEGPTTSAVLPLGIDFTIGVEGWSRSAAVESLIPYLQGLSADEQSKHLIVIEDAHSVAPLIQSFTGNEKLDLSKSHTITTCRLGAEDVVLKRLREFWAIDPVCVYIDPRANAESMIDVALASVAPSNPETARLGFLAVFRMAGDNLVILRVVIARWIEEPHLEISMDLAYEAATRELRRIAAAMTEGNDSAQDRATLAIVWMISGLDLPASQGFLSSFFGLDLSQSQIKKLIQQRECDLLDADAIAVRRHPAWGLLILKAIDHYQFLGTERKAIIQGFKSSTITSMSGNCQTHMSRDWKASECLIFALLEAHQVTAPDLAFTCSGKHISDEFAKAVLVRVDCKEADGAEKGELGEEITAIVDNLRRVSSRDPNQQIQDWQDGEKLLIEAIGLREAKFGVGLQGDLRAGYIYYQRGYYEYLLGRFDDARTTFAQSADSDISIGGRDVFAGMSKVAEAIAALAIGDLDDAEMIIRVSLNLIGSDTTRFGHRFRGNAHMALFELRLRRGDTIGAESSLETFLDEFDSAGLHPPRSLVDARLSLKKGDLASAASHVDKVFEDPEAMSDAETRIQATRVKADCLLSAGKFTETEELYNNVLPTDLAGPLSFEHQLCVNRLNRIRGTQASATLGQQIVASSII
jgi:tetratricopeptide (TPR) repeat protein